MDTNSLVKEAIARYERLHNEALRARANYSEYQSLYNWLIATRRMFPEAFSELPDEPAIPAEPSGTLVDLPKVDPREFEPAPQAIKTIDSMLTGFQSLQESLTLSARRSLNEKALEIVENILSENRPQKLDAIIEEMKMRKWDGYPIDEPVNLYNALQTRARKNDRFVNLGDNMWDLIQLSGGEP